MELLGVAQKYQMDSVLSHIRGVISQQDPPFIRPEMAFHIYFLAQRHALHQEALQAARITLRLPIMMTIDYLADQLELPGMTGAYLHELWKYHARVQADLKLAVSEFRKSGLPDGIEGLRCAEANSYNRIFPRWFHSYFDSMVEALDLFDPIEFEIARMRHIKGTYGSRTCSCANIPREVIRAFWEALTAVVRGTIDKAGLTLTLVKEEPTLEPISENSDPPSLQILDIPDANIILRSSDQVNFPVRKSVLAISSSFFKDLLSLPQPPDGELVDGLPVIAVSEDACLLNSLVSLLYPIPPVIPDSYEKVFALLSACQKYEMESVQSNIRAGIKLGTFPGPVGTESFSAYALASSMGLDPEMESAAHLTLDYPIALESLGDGLRSFKGQALCDLIRYRKRCS